MQVYCFFDVASHMFDLPFFADDKESEESDQGKILMLLIVTNCMVFPRNAIQC